MKVVLCERVNDLRHSLFHLLNCVPKKMSSVSFIKVINKVFIEIIYIYCHSQTDCFVLSELFSEARQARFPKLGLKPGWLIRQSKILPLSHVETSTSEGNLNAYVSHLFTYLRLTATIYIYIVIHRQIYFVLSELISVAKQYLPVAGIETRLTQTPSQSF